VKIHDGRAAARTAAEVLPDLVLLDYEMPEMDGLQVIAQLRADPVTQGIPVLLASAAKVSMADIRLADGFLGKPFQEDLLYQMIDRVLRAREVRS
jgi:CheY-like chemotaxis protein